MGGHQARTYWEGTGLVILWVAFLAGPAAWALNQLLGYALVKPACAGGSTAWLTLVCAAMLALVLIAIWASRRSLSQLSGAAEDGGVQEDSARFLATAALGLNALIALLLVTAAVAPFVLSPCE